MKESDKEDNKQQSEKLEENNFVSQFVKSSFNSLESDNKEQQEDEQENGETGEVLLYLVVLHNGEFYRLVDLKKVYNDTHEQYISKINAKKMFTEKELERNSFKIFDRESKQLAIKDTNVYFQTYNSNYMTPSTVREMLARYCFDAGLEYKGAHAFRHTHAVLSLEAGADLLFVSKRLAHGKIQTTADTYLDITPIYESHELEKITNYLNTRKEKEDDFDEI